MQVDYLIVGAGLAGSVLAFELASRGRRLVLVDDAAPGQAFPVAAGLVNPVTGPRFAVEPRLQPMRSRACETYRALEQKGGGPLWEEVEVLRVLTSTKEREAYRNRVRKQEAESVLGAWRSAPERASHLNIPHGAVEIRQAARVAPSDIVTAARNSLPPSCECIHERFEHEALHVGAGSARWNSIQAQCVVFSEGHRVDTNPWFRGPAFRHAKGERMIIHVTGVETSCVFVGHGLHLLPLGKNRYWAGATYDWDDQSTEPTASARAFLCERLAEWLTVEFEVLDHAAGIRPITRRRTPVLGRHPDHPQLALFNGLGSKGVLRAPYYARMLADHLEQGASVDREVALDAHLRVR